MIITFGPGLEAKTKDSKDVAFEELRKLTGFSHNKAISLYSALLAADMLSVTDVGIGKYVDSFRNNKPEKFVRMSHAIDLLRKRDSKVIGWREISDLGWHFRNAAIKAHNNRSIKTESAFRYASGYDDYLEREEILKYEHV